MAGDKYTHISPQQHGTFILGKWPTWRTILFYVFISILYMFRANQCPSSGESIVSTQHLVYVTLCRWPFRQVRKFLSDLNTKRSPKQSDIYQRLYWYNWFSWWWAWGYSKHVENWNKRIEKNCASSWSFRKNHKKMHGQQYIYIYIYIYIYCINSTFSQYDTILYLLWWVSEVWHFDWCVLSVWGQDSTITGLLFRSETNRKVIQCSTRRQVWNYTNT